MANDFAAVLADPNFGNTGGRYDSFIRLALRLIEKNGRDIEILRDTAAGLLNPAKPHLGKRKRSSTVPARAVFDQPSLFQNLTQSTDEDLIKRSAWTALIAAQGLPAAPGIKDKVRTLGTQYQIVDQVSIAPGNDPILFIVLLELV